MDFAHLARQLNLVESVWKLIYTFVGIKYWPKSLLQYAFLVGKVSSLYLCGHSVSLTFLLVLSQDCVTLATITLSYVQAIYGKASAMFFLHKTELTNYSLEVPCQFYNCFYLFLRMKDIICTSFSVV